MNSEDLKMRFTKQCLLNLPPTFTFIMNNVSIHLILMEVVPCANIRQADTMVWLSSEHITHLPQQMHKTNPVNTMHWTPLSSYSFTMVQLQPCHCYIKSMPLWQPKTNTQHKIADT